MPLKSPIRWVGGKYKLRKQIVKLLPESNSYTCYAEIFGGAGWVLFAKEPSPVEILNDIDKELVNFFIVLRDHHEQLISKVLEFPFISRAFFDQLNSQEPGNLGELERAYRFYYLLMAGWGGEWENPRFQTSVTDFGNGNRMFGALRNLNSRLSLASERLSCVILENLDWRDCIDRYDDNKTVMFLDPPYPGNSCNYSHNMLSIEEHRTLAQKLSNVSCRWLLTSYDREEIKSIFSDFNILPVNFASGMDGENGRQNSEIIVTNYDINEKALTDILPIIENPKLNDEIRVVSGEFKGVEGFVQNCFENKVYIKHSPFTKDDVIVVDCSNVIIVRRFSERYKLDRKIQNVRKDISSNIPLETILKLFSLKETGLIKNVPDFISQSILDALSELDKSDEN